MGRVTAVVNQKGGVGKTTSAVSVAAILADRGHRVLLCDMDPQGNATSGAGVERKDRETGLYEALVGETPLTDALVDTRWTNLTVAPSTIDLAGLEVELASTPRDPSGEDREDWRQRRLAEALAPVRPDFDLIVIDAPPSLGLLTVNALTAADGVLIPVQTEYYALEGLSQLLNTVSTVQRGLNPALGFDGVFLTMHDGRTNLSRHVAGEVRTFFGPRAYGTIVPRNVRLSEAPSYGEPIHVYAPGSTGAKAYAGVAEELARRLDLPARGLDPEAWAERLAAQGDEDKADETDETDAAEVDEVDETDIEEREEVA